MIARVIIAGSRTLELSPEEMVRAIHNVDPGGLLWNRHEWLEIVSGGARGIDLCGEALAKHLGIGVHRDPVTHEDYDRFGRYLAPKMRNRRMAEYADGAICFWDGTSGGTADMVCRMVARDKPVRVIPWHVARKR